METKLAVCFSRGWRRKGKNKMLNTEIREVLGRDRRSELRLRLAASGASSPRESIMYARQIIGEPKREVVDRLIEKVREL